MSDILSVGDWRFMEFGFKTHEWYVYKITGNEVQIGNKSWLVSASMWVDKDDFIKKSTFITRGKFRWWWLFLPFINDGICPFTAVKINP